MEAALGAADWVLGHPFGFGLQISSAAELFGVLGLLGGIFSLIMEQGTGFTLPHSVSWAALREFLMSLGRMWGMRQGFHQPVHPFPDTEVGISGV